MNTEELKLILEAIGELSESAKGLGVWYLVVAAARSLVPSVLLFSFGVLAVYKTAGIIRSGIVLYRAPRDIADFLGVPYSTDWTRHETDAVISAIRSLKQRAGR